jgi:hypothetical protein
VVGVGLLVRAWAGLALFVISYLNLPIFTSLHTSDGFWHLAPDARVYYDLAVTAASGTPIPPGSPSKSFLEVMAVWLRVFGQSPASGVLFNLVLYTASVVTVIAAFRRLDSAATPGAVVSVSALSFSPVLIMLGTQPLKDVFSVFLIVIFCVGAMMLLAVASRFMSGGHSVLVILTIALAVALMAGVRAYYAVLLWGAAAVATIVWIVMLPWALAIRRLPLALGGLAVIWCAFMWGAGPYYPYYGGLVTQVTGVHIPFVSPGSDAPVALPGQEEYGFAAAGLTLRMSRAAFVRSGGGTNLASGAAYEGDNGVLLALFGLVTIFVPISALQQLSLAEVSGGKGFLVITDLDTLFMDAALLAVVGVLFASRRLDRRQVPYLCFAVTLGIVTAVLMAYVVTNYGTLFRLRLLAVVPLWLLPLALVPLTQPHSASVAFTAGRRDDVGPDTERTVVGSPGPV